jgi:hypothetical protein
MRVFKWKMLKEISGPTREETKRAGENFITRNYIVLLLTLFHSGDRMQLNETGGECGRFFGQKEKDQLNKLGVNKIT